MTLTLLSAKEKLAAHLSDTTNLTWSASTLEEAIRSALNELSVVYDAAQTINGLDSALVTTLDEVDEPGLLCGARAYALTFRAVGRFEEAIPEQTLVEEFADYAQKEMKRFQGFLVRTQLRRFQESTSSPYSQWKWDETEDFS